MEQVWLIAALWLSLSLLASFLSSWVRLPTAVCEIIIGALAPLLLAPVLGSNALDPSLPWIAFLAGAAALLLTFLAGSELDPAILQSTWREALVIGALGFGVPLLGVAAVAHYLLGWRGPAGWIAAIALSTASVSITYTILVDLGLNRTKLGQSLLAASYVNNLLTTMAMGVAFAPFNLKTVIALVVSVAVFVALPFVSERFFARFHGRASHPEVRYVLFFLFGLAGLAVWGGGEAVLPAYVMGMLLAGLVGPNAALIHNLQVLTFSILTPFYFLRAGAQMGVPAMAAAPLLFAVLLIAKLAFKLIGVLPALRLFSYKPREAAYSSLMISTGMVLGTIVASIGLAHGILDKAQYSHIVAAVIGSAVIPSAVANAYFAPKHLMKKPEAVEAG